MTDKETISMLRYALATIWTECEKDEVNVENIEIITNLALQKSVIYSVGKIPTGLTGLDSFLRKYNQ